MSIIQISNLTKSYWRHMKSRKALDGVSLSVAAGEMVALIGPSGAGKSTLLRHIAGLVTSDRNPACEVRMDGQIVQRAGRLGSRARTLRAGIGFVFQQFQLVGRLSVLANVLIGMLPRVPWWRSLLMWFHGHEKRRALAALDRVGIGECAGQRASTLSGGQQQRAAIARALVQGAKVILGDEPIASLDPESSRRVMELLAGINREDGVTVIVSLHQVEFAQAYCPRTVAMRDGCVVYDGPTADLSPDRLQEIYRIGPATSPPPTSSEPARSSWRTRRFALATAAAAE